MITRRAPLWILLGSIAACGAPTRFNGPELGTGGLGSASGGAKTSGGASNVGGARATGGGSSGGQTATTGGAFGSGGTGGRATGGADAAGGSAASGGTAGGAGGQASVGGQGPDETGGAASTGGSASSCAGEPWPTADPKKAGPFQVTADKHVGPLAGVVPDPIYGNNQQRFNVYRPSNLASSGYCHPILVWANGYKDNPEQNPPDCVVNSSSNQWCGQYLPMVSHLASHGFVVVASLSTATAEGDPLPTIAGLDWILEQAEEPTSPYYHRLDTQNIGQLGHSYGAMSTCMSAAEPRYKALAALCGTRALTGLHTPMLFFCGGKDTTVACSGVKEVFNSVKDQPAFFLNELDSDHGSWVYEGAGGVSLSAAAAWFRVHLMGDTANRKFFYGPSCTFCSDNRAQAEQNSLMAQ